MKFFFRVLIFLYFWFTWTYSSISRVHDHATLISNAYDFGNWKTVISSLAHACTKHHNCTANRPTPHGHSSASQRHRTRIETWNTNSKFDRNKCIFHWLMVVIQLQLLVDLLIIDFPTIEQGFTSVCFVRLFYFSSHSIQLSSFFLCQFEREWPLRGDMCTPSTRFIFTQVAFETVAASECVCVWVCFLSRIFYGNERNWGTGKRSTENKTHKMHTQFQLNTR